LPREYIGAPYEVLCFLANSAVIDAVSPEKHRFARLAAIRVLTITRLQRRRRGGKLVKFLVIGLTVFGLLGIGGGAEAVDTYQSYTRDLPDPIATASSSTLSTPTA